MNHNSLTTIFSKVHLEYSNIWHYVTQKPIGLRCPRYTWEDVEQVQWYKNELEETLWVSNLIIADQVHSDISREITSENKNQIHEVDALYTWEKNIALFVLASDCVPILFYDTKLEIVWAIHAGRAGLEKWIIQKVFSEILEKYHSEISDFRVYIWPHICQSCYEVWEEQVAPFKKKYPNCISKSVNTWKYMIDIWAIAMQQIQALGVDMSHIEHSELCTYEEKDTLHSYRRKTHTWEENYGNNGFGIWLK